jgi:hypothetical protein
MPADGWMFSLLRCAIFGLCTGSLTTGAQALRMWDRSCYGDTVEVTLVSQMTGEPKIPLSIPIGGYVLDVAGYAPPGQQTPYYPTKDCVKEPILARSVYILTEHHMVKALGFTPDKPTVRRFELSYGRGYTSAHYNSRAEEIRNSQLEGKSVSLPGGFVKIRPTPYEKVGDFIAPVPHVEPSGKPLIFDCSPAVRSAECYLAYWLPGDITLSYWFMSDSVPRSRWLELDQLMREIAVSFIARSYWPTWKNTTGGIHD